MGILDTLFGRNDGRVTVDWLGPTFRSMVLGLTPEELYRTQPHLRIVLSFVARNIAHLGLKAYARTSETDRTRLREDPIALLMKRPNATMTMFEVLEALASDMGLYDVGYWLIAEDTNAPSGWVIQPIPASWVIEHRGGDAFTPASYVVQNPGGTRTVVDAEQMLVFHGWNPGRPKHGAAPIETLKQILAEQVQAWSYREQIWQRGGRVGAYITRPKDASWSPEARDRFMDAWKARWTGMEGAKAGGTPILEDGMELKRLGLSAREEEWSEVAKVALATVAAVYHVNPVMVGILDNANFSNTKEFRKMLYSETLGPQLARIEDRINTFLVPRIAKTAGAYVEFNIEEKLQGDFEEQAAILSTSAGAPWMTRNEVRALRNLPAMNGGDQLVVPLNVLTGGQASPRDSAPPKARALPESKAAPAHVEGRLSVKSDDMNTDEYLVLAENLFDRFFGRQRAAVQSALGAKSDEDWWDEDRWDEELGDDLYKLATKTAGELGRSQAESLGFSAGDYDEDRTLAFLRAVSDTRAKAVNSATFAQLQAALSSDDEGDDVGDVFSRAHTQRSAAGAGAFVATLAGFALVEVGKQLLGKTAEKTWNTGPNPRPAHAAMDGETVGIDDTFSNGMTWPGDIAGGADEVAGCNCGVTVTYG